MKNFNINDYMYIQITESGWDHLRRTVGEDYIKHCITADGYMQEINGETWYRLQCHSAFGLFPYITGGALFFKTNVMFDDNEQDQSIKRIEELEKILTKIANWELPSTGKFWDEDNSQPTSYEVEFGSNGARDYIKSIARESLNSSHD